MYILADTDLFSQNLKKQKNRVKIDVKKKPWQRHMQKQQCKILETKPRKKRGNYSKKLSQSPRVAAYAFCKGIGFCLIKKKTCELKLETVVQSAQCLK